MPTIAPAEPREGLLTPAEAAAYLGIAPRTLKKWVQLKRIETVRYGRQQVRFSRRVLDRFIARHVEPADERTR